VSEENEAEPSEETYSEGDWTVVVEDNGVLRLDVEEDDEWTDVELSHATLVVLLAMVSDDERAAVRYSESENSVEFLQVSAENVKAWRAGSPVLLEEFLETLGESIAVALLTYLTQLAEEKTKERRETPPE
jgi:hypothetical protein